jgi:hypothetical protein
MLGCGPVTMLSFSSAIRDRFVSIRGTVLGIGLPSSATASLFEM